MMDSSCKCTTDLVHGVTLTIVPVPRGYAGLVAVDCVSSEAGVTDLKLASEYYYALCTLQREIKAILDTFSLPLQMPQTAFDTCKGRY